MIIIQGRGRNRKVIHEMIPASIVKAGADKDQKQYAGLLCDIMGVGG